MHTLVNFLSKTVKPLTTAGLAISGLACAGIAWAADDVPSAVAAVSAEEIVAPKKARGAAAILMEEVVTSARKKSAGEEVQDVPIQISAFSGEQLDALQMRNISDMSFSMPNVTLDPVGTSIGTANFSIRGMGTSSSIPSTDPTVGVFVDGMYYGISWGVIQDTFDLEGMEVLRGPQGTLFGRNVTGGAVTMRTRRPSHEFSLRAKTSVTDDNDQVYALSTTGSLIEDVVAGKLAVYYRNDGGYFDNIAPGGSSKAGKSETFLVRPAITITPSEDLDITFMYEYGQTQGDGGMSQNQQSFAPLSIPDLGDFEVNLNNEGDTDGEWQSLVMETNYQVGFGNGVITNILGYRDFEQFSSVDIDSTQYDHFDLNGRTDQDQISNELRFAGTFFDGGLDLTVGHYYFKQNLTYVEDRKAGVDLGAGANGVGVQAVYGGTQDSTIWGVFSQGDIHLSDSVILTLGMRYTEEEKDVEVALGGFSSLPFPITDQPCTVAEPKCTDFDFIDEGAWSSWTPKVGLQWFYNESSSMYFSWSKGYRSGGYNLRNTNPDFPPGPTEQEQQNAWELGLKSEWMDGRVTMNAAVFRNIYDDVQRDTLDNQARQVTLNAGQLTIDGAEVEIKALVTDNLVVSLSAGYLDGQYDDLVADLTGDTVIDGADEGLIPPRLARWSTQVGFNYDIPLESDGLVSLRGSYSHRTPSPFNDDNTGIVPSVDMVDAGLAYTTPDGQWTATLYGKNLLDDQRPTTVAPLVFGFPFTYAPLAKGRVLGLELQYQY
ncbi:MAG: TonB-dependent receptor [Porticoccaceae bacterium]|nr:TonB-dependent receptor [Porticoccaceae bacterium]